VNFDESVKYLLSLGNEVLAMKLGLGNIRKLLNVLDNPQNKYFKVQVAGTNGKGSTCAFLEAICLSANVKTGLFTSPHLISIAERVRINGREISEDDFARYATRIREIGEELADSGGLESIPTFFEQVTAIALYAFAEAGVELAILETGLGGRLDATTAANAEIAVMTRIDYDHQAILGDTIEAIAAEKAAIIRSDSRVVVGPQKPEAAMVIERVCAEKGTIAVENFRWEATGFGFTPGQEGKIRGNFETAGGSYPDVYLGLAGRHQVENAGVAILAAEILSEKFPITRENIISGLKRARHKGRLEFKGNILFDGAHNAAGARALATYLDEFIGPVTLVFGAMKDKDLPEIASVLFPLAERLILTRSSNERSVETSELSKLASGNKFVLETPTVQKALDQALDWAAPEDIICITGSLYLVGEAQKLLNNNAYE
jgi:dihydrofolate synthase/folylpolyglutamate synthase